MALILNIDTATERASVSLSNHRKTLSLLQNKNQKDHASWLQVAIKQLLTETGHDITDLQAVAVTAGPGSYTGLRVGMASAKGLCYALKIPLITESTLKVMAHAAQEQARVLDSLICPMIDARRMEVFAALYTAELEELRPAEVLLLDAGSLAIELSHHRILFFGTGMEKWKGKISTYNAFFNDIAFSAEDLSYFSDQKFDNQEFTDVIYSEPEYGKEFFTHIKK